MKHKFHVEKAIEVILYIASQCTNIYNILKVIYFADKEHLTRYGRLIYEDSYVAMSHGPVPSGAYDLVKYARGESLWDSNLPFDIGFSVEGHHLIPCRKANIDLLSESDVECLDIAIQKYGTLSFNQLKRISHAEEAYQSADQDDFIPLEAIIQSLPDSDMLLDYVQNN